MTYESKWKAVIDNEWDTYKKKWEEDHPGTKPPQGRFAFMNTFLKNKYQEEPEEVKVEVRTRRAAMKEEVEKTQQQNKSYQKWFKFQPLSLWKSLTHSLVQLINSLVLLL